jgi:NAD(P)-dependent dehydrogenase (short-subunit alcohol dehydrogenase family)
MKNSLNALTVALASELRCTNILVNAVCPGWVRTGIRGLTSLRAVEKGAETPVWLATLSNGGPSVLPRQGCDTLVVSIPKIARQP